MQYANVDYSLPSQERVDDILFNAKKPVAMMQNLQIPKTLPPLRGCPVRMAGRRRKTGYEKGLEAKKKCVYSCSLCRMADHTMKDYSLKQMYGDTAEKPSSRSFSNALVSDFARHLVQFIAPSTLFRFCHPSRTTKFFSVTPLLKTSPIKSPQIFLSRMGASANLTESPPQHYKKSHLTPFLPQKDHCRPTKRKISLSLVWLSIFRSINSVLSRRKEERGVKRAPLSGYSRKEGGRGFNLQWTYSFII